MADAQGDAADLQNDRGVFRAEYERELGKWLRRRLGWLCIAYGVFWTLSTTLVIVSTLMAEQAKPAQVAPPMSPVEIRADRAEKRAEAGLPPRPGDARAIEAAHALEKRREERQRGSEAVVSTIDAFGMLAREIAQDIRRPTRRDGQQKPPPPQSGSRLMDRWWLDEPPAASDGHPVATPADGPGSKRTTPEDAHAAGTSPADGGERVDGTAKPTAGAGAGTGAGAGADAEMKGDASNEPATEPDAETISSSPSSPSPSSASTAKSTATAPLVLPWWAWVLSALPIFGVVGWYGLAVRPKLYTREELVSAASRMVLTLSLLNFAFESALLLADPNAPVLPLVSVFCWHLTASLFLPWSWRESLRPIVPVLICWALLRAGLAAGDGSWVSTALSIAFAPLLFLPALVLCYTRLRWHRNRFKTGFVGRRFLEMRREFVQARAVHESLFPKPIDADWMRFEFSYRPAADIGGDFIHVWTDDSERFHLALIDVTGHGLASAMSVARIHGEIERLRDEYPNEGPAKILARLNRYFHRLLARHKLYASGILLTIDPHSGELRYASAGHPPMFLRSRGKITELESTTLLLGAADDSIFGEEELTVKLEEGDTLVLFTDGAYEAQSPRGERLGLDRIREIMQRPTAPPRWTQYMMRLVETFEAGMAEDDLLIAEVNFLSRRSVSSITGDDVPIPAQRYAGAGAGSGSGSGSGS